MNQYRNIFPLLTLFLLDLLSLSSASALEDQRKDLRTITISANGQILSQPDLARLHSGVITEDKTARGALSKNNSATHTLIEGLRSKGIESKDIQTSSFQVEPRYTIPREGSPSVIDGYRVVNQVEIIVRDLKSIGELLDQLVSLGANQVGSLSFEVSAAEQLKDSARKEAVMNARRRAELYANATGSKLGKVLVITEGDISNPQPLLRAARATVSDAVPIEKGSIALEANVTITWELE
ncbi:MAG: SIMPL domain-containing protein [Hyphomicrobium sp.]